ncbi:MAG: CoA transferase [Rhodospirillaceae bacterium]|nr:CoA transferase [Rhodospirillaceae bacterium]
MKPLAGIKVVELARVLATPFAGMILAELGAEVVKIEQPGKGDETRSFEPPVGDESAYFFACNRSKRSITVDFRGLAGQDIVRRLVANADVLLENFPVGSLKRYDLDHAALLKLNPKLVYVSCTGFGQTGPYAERKGYDTIFQAMGGLMGLTGEVGGGPVKPGLPMADLTSGLWIGIGVLSMLAGRARSGHGGYLDFAMLDGQVSLLTLAAARFFALGEVPLRLGTEHPGRVPSAAFVCADAKWLHITCSDQHWQGMCRVLHLDDLAADATLADNAGRVRGRDRVMTRMREAASTWTRDALVEALISADVPAGPVNDLDQVLADPHVAAREMVSSFAHPTVGDFRALRLPYRFEGFDAPAVGCPPLLGEHTDEVLAELGFTAVDIARLRAKKVV